MVIKIEIFLAILFILEAWLETTIIKLKNPLLPDYKELNNQEHLRSFLFAGFLILGTSFIGKHLELIPSLIISRRLFFDYFLKILRKRPFKNIEGTGPIDNTLRKIFGKEGAWIECLTIIVIKLVYLQILYQNMY